MSELAVLFIVLMMLGCAVVMGGMIVMAWRGMRQNRAAHAEPDGHGRSVRSDDGR